MTEVAAKAAMANALKDTTELVRKGGISPEIYREEPLYYDDQRDGPITGRPSFKAASSELSNLRVVQQHYGADRAESLALGIVWNYLKLPEAPEYDDVVFDALWTDFLSEITDPHWTYIGITNLWNFHLDSLSLDLGDGISVHIHSYESLRDRLRLSPYDYDTIQHDARSGWGSDPTAVLLVEVRPPKTSETIGYVNAPEMSTKVDRAILALRLLKQGDASIGAVFEIRPDRFFLRRGLSSYYAFSGMHTSFPGTVYQLLSTDITAFQAIYRSLEEFESRHSVKWANIEVALRSFSTSYGRMAGRTEDRVLDAVTALEALLIETNTGEFAHKLAFRAAAILANSDDERSELFDRLKDYYNTRSVIVHGVRIKDKDLQIIRNPGQLLDIVRELLKAFLSVANAGRVKASFYEHLDSKLLHSERREDVRRLMGIGMS